MDVANPQSPTFRGGGRGSHWTSWLIPAISSWLAASMHLHHGPTWYPLQRANQIWADEGLTAGQRRSLLEQNHRQAA
eukprot:6208907-Amphidinium_carterae.1